MDWQGRGAEGGAGLLSDADAVWWAILWWRLRHTPLLPALPVRALPSPCSNYWRREAKKVHLRD